MTNKTLPVVAQARALAVPTPLSPHDGLKRYLQEIAKFPILEPKEEYDLAVRLKEHGDMAAAHRLVTSHLRLVAKIAYKFKGYGLPMSELISEGNVGMMQAVKRFEPEKGFRLSTYAMWWIKAAIQEYILKSWSLVKVGTSATQKRLFFNLNKMKKKIGATDNNSLSEAQIDEIAHELDVKRDEVISMNNRMTASDVFLNTPMGEEGDAQKIDFLADERGSHEDALADHEESSIKHQQLYSAMSALSEREQDIIKRRKLKDDPDTLEILSQEYNVSRERIRQIEVRAFEKLQKQMLATLPVSA